MYKSMEPKASEFYSSNAFITYLSFFKIFPHQVKWQSRILLKTTHFLFNEIGHFFFGLHEGSYVLVVD